MAFVQADIDTLKAAIATGASQVRYADGRQVTYRTLDEMLKALKMIDGEVNPSPSKTSRSSVASF
jgi:hypothetical protein